MPRPPTLSAGIPTVGAWRSLVAHYNGVVGVAGSNPVAPTILTSCLIATNANLHTMLQRGAPNKTGGLSTFLNQEHRDDNGIENRADAAKAQAKRP